MKIKKSYINYSLIIIAILLIILSINFLPNTSDELIYQNGRIFISQNRPSPSYEKSLLSNNGTHDVYSVIYDSKKFMNAPTVMHALLFLPNDGKKIHPGIVFLPGGGVRKESEYFMGEMFANKGIAFFVMDQRGVGQTGGYYLGFQEDYTILTQRNQSVQQLSIYDALKAFDVLKEIDGIDKNNIMMIGESMGGRYAIPAVALDKNIKGLIVISSAGFHINEDDPAEYIPYLASIDPDKYASEIYPRRVVFFQGDNDTVVPLSDAQITFSIAKEPKKLYIEEGCTHGYCEKMMDDSVREVKNILKI